ncbi:MAG TPA: Gfo/Idh/MocA family oxidoreductase [Verrucomicrobiae bacterium]|nr:Gfo/Idh/MocA family oxidoreductase [Verrucomicrobiae bacterium]
MKKFNVGIIGYGWAATAHIGAINAGSLARVGAVYSSRPLDAAELSRKHGGEIKAYTSVKSMLADPEIDVIGITSYPWEHAEQIIAAAKAGKHIIAEKPLVLSLKDLRRVEQAIRAAKVGFTVCFECRFAGHFLTVKSVIDRGLLGKLHYGEVDYYHGIGPWYGQYRWNTSKKGGGSSLLTAGCHALDALLLCMGGEVEEVTSYDTQSANQVFQKYEYPTTSVTILKFKGGAVGKCAAVVDCFQPYYFHTHLVGSEGSLLDNKFHSNQLAALNKQHWSELSMKLVDSGDVADHPYQTQFDAFFAALAEGREMPLTGLKEAVSTHEVIFAADRSAATGKPVKLSQIRKGR